MRVGIRSLCLQALILLVGAPSVTARYALLTRPAANESLSARVFGIDSPHRTIPLVSRSSRFTKRTGGRAEARPSGGTRFCVSIR